MQIVLATDDGDRELDVVVHDPEATVADLVVALARAAGSTGALRSDEAAGGHDLPLVIEADGTLVPSGRRLDRAGIRSGSRLRLVRDRVDAPTSPPVEVTTVGRAVSGARAAADAGLELPARRTEVAVVGGLAAGARMPVEPGRWVLGRGGPPPTRDLRSIVPSHIDLGHDTVSARHADLDIDASGTATVTDTGSLNGTWVDGRPVTRPTPLLPGGIARLGAVQVTVRPATTDDRAHRPSGLTRAGPTVPFNRPPRAARPPAPEPLETPEPPAGSSAPSAIGVMAVLAPLAMGGALVAITGQLTYALFVLLSPVMVVGGAIDARRRGRKGRRREEARFDRQVAELTTALDRRAEDERARRADEIPDMAELLRRVEEPSTRLWERRPRHPDWLLLRVGIGSDRWDPPVHGDRRSWPDAVREAIRAGSHLTDAPVPIDLSGGGVVGVVGPRPVALALCRALVVQACTLHGPADLPTLVMTAPDRTDDWDWAKWLPHTLDPGGAGYRRITADAAGAEAQARTLLGATEDGPGTAGDTTVAGPTPLVVVDDETLTEGRRAPVRSLLRGRAGLVAGIVVATSEDRLPSTCTTVVELVDADGTARVHRVGDGLRLDGILAGGISEATARRAARGLARFDDPEHDGTGAGLPPSAALLPLLDLDPPDPATVARRWVAGGADPDLATPIGVTEDGVLAVDLVRDGPHALVAGTTGAGKSELLRSLVAGLAAGSSPDHCTFVLLDFKGGSAFDCCADLPHTVGLVTDLDAHLAERALRCLEAEVRHRERVLREAGVSDLGAYRRLPAGGRGPLPRLVVAVDEFATLRAELPDFVESLVSVAQRGRSLGIHLVLATQRPSGAVSESIRANTNLRIALRVQDIVDSQDVIDRPDAARIGRSQPGRALVRFGPGEVVALQTALSTGFGGSGRGPVEVGPFRIGRPSDRPGPASDEGEGTEGPSDLVRLVAACRRAHAASGRPPPRRPWLDPLPGDVDLAEVMGGATGTASIAPFGSPGVGVPFALADDPDEQAQRPASWTPSNGNLLLAGLPGSGTTTALATVAVAATTSTSPDDLHLYVLDMGRGDLAVLAGLPHTGAVVTAADRERQARLVAWLRAELDRRRALPPGRGAPAVLVLVDGLGPFRAEWDDGASPILDDFDRVFAEGPELGLHLAVAADRSQALPPPLRSLVRQQFLFRLADELDYAHAGIRVADLPTFVPGRAVEAEGGREVQVARPTGGLGPAVATVAAGHGSPCRRPPPSIRSLPRDVSTADLLAHVRLDAVPRRVPLGIGETALGPVGLTLYGGEHALVAGPARSGRTTVLVVAGTVARHAGWRTAVVAATRSPLGAAGDLGPRIRPDDLRSDLPAVLDGNGGPDRPLLLLIDDAEGVDPDGELLPQVLARSDVVVVASGRAETLRGLYAHWVRTLRAGRVGVLLQPDVDADGDLLGVRLPRRTTTALGPGRGYLCHAGEVELIQVAQDTSASHDVYRDA